MSKSPYTNTNTTKWKNITIDLVDKYPLSLNEILEISLVAWSKLWSTKVGQTIEINEVELPAPVVGYFFQKLFAHELSKRYPIKWRGESDKADKDIVNLENNYFSTEMKSSGQLGYKVFGNRSYCQKSDTPSKAKSGYYITINFFEQTLTLVSIGWIDKEDWNCQDAESGQAATLPQEVYDYKLIKIHGKYQLKSPIALLNNVGKVTLLHLHNNSIFTFEDIINYDGKDKKINNVIENNKDFLNILRQYI